MPNQKLFPMNKNQIQFNAHCNLIRRPGVSGYSTIALTCKEGILIASNMSIFRGNFMYHSNVSTITSIGDNLVFGCSGEYGDYKKLEELLLQQWKTQKTHLGLSNPDPEEYSSYLAHLCYKMRTKVDPYYVDSIMAGMKDGKKTLYCIDLYGNKYSN